MIVDQPVFGFWKFKFLFQILIVNKEMEVIDLIIRLMKNTLSVYDIEICEAVRKVVVVNFIDAVVFLLMID